MYGTSSSDNWNNREQLSILSTLHLGHSCIFWNINVIIGFVLYYIFIHFYGFSLNQVDDLSCLCVLQNLKSKSCLQGEIKRSSGFVNVRMRVWVCVFVIMYLYMFSICSCDRRFLLLTLYIFSFILLPFYLGQCLSFILYIVYYLHSMGMIMVNCVGRFCNEIKFMFIDSV